MHLSLKAIDHSPRPGAARPKAVPVKNPVLLIPGFMLPTSTFDVLKGDLQKSGYTDISALSTWPGTNDIRDYARQARAMVKKIQARTGAKKVDILAHSEGGLVARYMMKRLGMEDAVDHLIVYGTPNHGTKLANAAKAIGLGNLPRPVTMAGEQMEYDSRFVRALNAGGETRGPAKVTTFRGGLDELIFPHSSPMLQGAKNVLIPWAMHLQMLFDPLVRKLTLHQLAQ